MDFQQFVSEIGSMIAPQPIMDLPALQQEHTKQQAQTTPSITVPQPRGREHVLEEGIAWIKEEFTLKQHEALETLKREAYQVKVLETDIAAIDEELARLTQERTKKIDALQQAQRTLTSAQHQIDTASQEVELRIQRLREALQN